VKNLHIFIFVVFCLTFFTIQCSQDSNPAGPGVSTETQSDGAFLSGNFATTGNNSVDFGLIQVSIRGTNIQVYPDSNGDFQISGLPTGNQSVEVDIANNLSFFNISDVQSGEEIQMQLQIQANNSVMLQNMYRNKKKAEDLQVEIRPKKWNIDWENSTDEGHVRLYGPGFDTIESVVITGPTGIEIPNSGPEIGGVYCKFFFNQSDAIDAIPTPTRGDRHYITVDVSPDFDNEPLTYPIVIVGAKSEPDDPDDPVVDLDMDINPKKWNTNWEKSGGYVTVRIRGEGFDMIETGATEMSYSTAITPFWDSITGSSYQAKFSKKEAIGLFPEADLQKGASFDVVVTVQIDGIPTPMLPYTIEIVGPKK
jgi:hypothetical protein